MSLSLARSSARSISASSSLLALRAPCLGLVAASAPRHFTSSATRRSTGKVFHDDTHPNSIYYHALAPRTWALSYLSTAPASSDAPSVLGTLTLPDSAAASSASAEQTPAQLAQAYAENVQSNKAFLEVLHKVLPGAVMDDGMIQYEAYLRKSGWAHVADQREQLMPGRIPNPENIIAMIGFESQELARDTYQINDVHRLVTVEYGVMQLRPAWAHLVKEACEKAVK